MRAVVEGGPVEDSDASGARGKVEGRAVDGVKGVELVGRAGEEKRVREHVEAAAGKGNAGEGARGELCED